MVWQNDNRHLKDPEYLAGEKPGRAKRAYALEPGLWFRPLEGPEAAERLAAAWAGADTAQGCPVRRMASSSCPLEHRQ